MDFNKAVIIRRSLNQAQSTKDLRSYNDQKMDKIKIWNYWGQASNSKIKKGKGQYEDAYGRILTNE